MRLPSMIGGLCHPQQASFLGGREVTDRLFELLTPSALYERPAPERHRLIFYLGHLEAFDWNLLGRKALGLPAVNDRLDRLFAFGIDPDSSALPSDAPTDWPAEEVVREYVERVRIRLDEVTAEVSEETVSMAAEHRLMHAETLCYLLHNLPYDRKRKPPLAPARRAEERERRPVEISEGRAVLGKPRDGVFGWDNEYDIHTVPSPRFRIDSHKVTNGDYLRFVEAGGDPPHFWIRRGAEWRYRGMFDEMPLAPDWPVYVTLIQARAYASFIGKRLPSEAEFHRAAYSTPDGGLRPRPWGDRAAQAVEGNFDFRRWDPVSVFAAPETDSAWGVSQLVGNGWEWTSTVFAPFDGFSAHPHYPGYSADFFDGKHFVLKGASARTADRLIRSSFRNWFRADYPHVYASFRCVEA